MTEEADYQHFSDAAEGFSRAADAFKSYVERSNPKKDEEEDVPVEKQPKSLDEAQVKVREHFRRAKAAAKAEEA